MKSILLVLVSILILTNAYAQRSALDDRSAEKFVTFFNAVQADSLYTLIADEIKPRLSLTMLSGAIPQIKASLGNLVKSEYFVSQNGVNTYIGVLEKSGPVLYLNFDKTHKIVGFFVNADQRKAVKPNEPINNFVLNTDGAVLKGTLSVPETTGPVTVVLLIAGSGPTDRDGNSRLGLTSNAYLQLSDALKAKNIAVLRYDKRGVGESSTTKSAAATTFNDFVDDAVAIVKTLKADKRFSKIIVTGHSEGSLIGMMACEREKADAYISLEGAGSPIDVVLKTQLKTALPAEDYTNAVKILDSIKVGQFTKQKLNENLTGLFNASVQPFLYSWMKYNPEQIISKLTIPVLIIQGTHDVQVSVSDAQLLKKGKPNAQLKPIPDMSHILKAAPADRAQNIATYNQPDLPLHPELVPALVQFIDGIK